MAAYYNEIDPFAAQWLRNLVAAGRIAAGTVDERDIQDVAPDDLRSYEQCHFFAGIGVWSYALRAAGLGDHAHAWTGSCPCQPFSAAGKGGGFADERHLWPAWFHLIRERSPSLLFGEQVASPDGLAWLDVVQADLEGEGYAFGALDLCAAGFGAPHIRQRLNWVAYAVRAGWAERRPSAGDRSTSGRRELGGLADSDGRDASATRLQRSREHGQQPQDGGAMRVGDADKPGLERRRLLDREREGERSLGPSSLDGPPRPGPVNGEWRNADWLGCTDGRWRPVEPGTFPLADGVAGRLGMVRAYGNAIVAPQTAAFVAAALECIP